MQIDVSIWTLVKLGIATLGTYFLLPLVLVARDRVLWWLIDEFILTEDLHRRVQVYTANGEKWNREYAVKTEFGWNQESGLRSLIDGRPVSSKEYFQFLKEQQQLGQRIDKDRWEIQKKKSLIDRLIKHYAQDDKNPVQVWVEREAEKAKQNYDERLAKSKASQDSSS